MNGFLKLQRGDDLFELLKSPNSFALLALVAARAWRGNGWNRHGLRVGQALIGDIKAVGLTPQEYRTAKSQLEKWSFVTFQPTNKGTVATLIDSRIFDINGEEPTSEPTIKQQSNNKRPTTNKKDKKEKKLFTPPSLSEVESYVKERNLPVEAKTFLEYYSANDWHDSTGKPVRSWKQKLVMWKNHTPAPVDLTNRQAQREREAIAQIGVMR